MCWGFCWNINYDPWLSEEKCQALAMSEFYGMWNNYSLKKPTTLFECRIIKWEPAASTTGLGPAGISWRSATRGLPAWQLLAAFVFVFPKIPGFEKISQIQLWGAKKHSDFFSLSLLPRSSRLRKWLCKFSLKSGCSVCLANKPECFTLNNWAALYPRGPGCCQWAQGSEDARSLTRKVLPMRNPGPTSAPGLSSSCSQKCKERDMEKWQRCSSWCSQSEQQEIPWQNLSFFCVKFAL